MTGLLMVRQGTRSDDIISCVNCCIGGFAIMSIAGCVALPIILPVSTRDRDQTFSRSFLLYSLYSLSCSLSRPLAFSIILVDYVLQSPQYTIPSRNYSSRLQLWICSSPLDYKHDQGNRHRKHQETLEHIINMLC